MTDGNTHDLRVGIERLVRLAGSRHGEVVLDYGLSEPFPARVIKASVGVHFRFTRHAEDTPELTTAQQLALSVLLGDPAVSVNYLLDRCQDDGSFVLRTADEVRAEGRAEAVADCAPWLRRRANAIDGGDMFFALEPHGFDADHARHLRRAADHMVERFLPPSHPGNTGVEVPT